VLDHTGREDGQECLPQLLSGKNAISLECQLTEDEKMVRNVFHDYCQVKRHQSGVLDHTGQVKAPLVWGRGSLRTRKWSGMSWVLLANRHETF
jgi:hypothetical protein